LFHHHIHAIDRWIYHEALSLVPSVANVKAIGLFTFPLAWDRAKALGWILPDLEPVVLTILQATHFFAESDLTQDGQPCPHSYSLHLGPPLTGVSMLDLLVLEAMQDPTRNARYKLDGEKCAQIAQSLWLSVLPS